MILRKKTSWTGLISSRRYLAHAPDNAKQKDAMSIKTIPSLM